MEKDIYLQRNININNNNTKNEKKIAERQLIEKEIAKCLQDIDKKYYNPNFNLMGEIVNIFGDINWEKVKLDIERLNKIDEKLDKVTKLIVDEHSEEFYKILGFVRQMQKEIETAKSKTVEAKDLLQNIHSLVSNLSRGENSEWKLRSFYCTEIISKLNKTQQIFKIIQDCEVYIENSKIFDAIIMLKKSQDEHLEYDKEFRNFSFLVSINMRFEKIKENIEEKILQNLNNIIFFTQENTLKRKISSLIIYFLNSYTKISIDNELSKPLQTFLYITHNIVNNNIKDYNLENDTNSDGYFKENIIDLDSSKKLSSLIYLIKCLKNYDNSINIFLKFNEKINENLSSLLERTVQLLTEGLKNIDFSKYDLEGKNEKIKFLLFFKVLLIIFYHGFVKIVCLNSYLKNTCITEIIEKIYLSIEKIILLPLTVFNKISAPIQNDQENSSDLYGEYVQGESVVRMKINEVLTNNIENLPILFKIYDNFIETFQRLFINVRLFLLSNQLNSYSERLYYYYWKKIIPKKIFDMNSFITDYDSETSNFKFIQDFTIKINKLKELLIFAFDSGFVELLKIFRDMFNKYYEETKSFLENIKAKCVYNINFHGIYDEFIKLNDFRELKEISFKLEFKKYEKKIIEINDYNKNVDKITNILSNLINTNGRLPPDNLVLLTRNYKLVELITKFISCTQIIINVGENFIFDVMKRQFSNAKMMAILEQVNSMHFIDLKESKDISSLIMVSLRILEKLSEEITKLILICKIEFSFLITSLVRNISKNEYWLHEPQMTPEYFITAFINEFNTYNSLLENNLNSNEYQFIIKDFLLLVNNSFINSIKTIASNSINNFGVNLLIRNFEYIKDKIGIQSKFQDIHFTKTIYYFPNYIKLLNLNEGVLIEELKNHYHITPYDEEFITPILTIRTNSRLTLSANERSKIIQYIFK